MSAPFFSIITPTLQRESLVRCCESVISQSFADWETIIQVDDAAIDSELFSRIPPTRKIGVEECGNRHGHYGNRCRHLAWERATGRYLVMLDDDNAMFHADALQNIHDWLVAEDLPDWALFPIHRHGSKFLLLPPGMCRTDSANMVVKREIGRWPDIEAREADGVLAEHLLANYAYSAFPHCQPIILMEKSSNGV